MLTDRLINQSINQSINQPTTQSVSQSIKQSAGQLGIGQTDHNKNNISLAAFDASWVLHANLRFLRTQMIFFFNYPFQYKMIG